MTKTTREMIEVMEAHERGEIIECIERRVEDTWDELENPSWDWYHMDYRIAPSTPDTINWDHVAPEYKWMARDKDGRAYLYIEKPTADHNNWLSTLCCQASVFSSYKRGTVFWDNSLVERPSK